MTTRALMAALLATASFAIGFALGGFLSPDQQAALSLFLLLAGFVLVFPLLATSYASILTRGSVRPAGVSHAIVGSMLIVSALAFGLGLALAGLLH